MTSPMSPLVYLNWQIDGKIVTGYNSPNVVSTGLIFPVGFPNTKTQGQTVTITSSSRDLGTYEVFKNVSFYLTGSDSNIQTVQNAWPALGGGLEVSFDGGQTFTAFDSTHGNQNEPATWIPLPSSAVSSGVAGTLGPFDLATLIIKYVIPQQADQIGVIEVKIQADFDVV